MCEIIQEVRPNVQEKKSCTFLDCTEGPKDFYGLKLSSTMELNPKVESIFNLTG